MKSVKSSYLITGGCRSGKSRYALKLAESAEKPFFIATAGIGDEEMRERVAAHQKERGIHWTTIEEKFDLESAVAKAVDSGADFIVVDCLTLWISNIMFQDDLNIEDEIEKLIRVIKKTKIPLLFVTNEVGMGIVPDNRLAREFRDNAGRVNREVAETVDSVVLTVAGIPVTVKG